MKHRKHRIATIAAAALLFGGAVCIASSASARDYFSVSIGVPGLAVGYANPGYYAPPVAYGPPAAYYGAPLAYAAAPLYGPRVVYGRPFYRPYYHAHYWHR